MLSSLGWNVVAVCIMKSVGADFSLEQPQLKGCFCLLVGGAGGNFGLEQQPQLRRCCCLLCGRCASGSWTGAASAEVLLLFALREL